MTLDFWPSQALLSRCLGGEIRVSGYQILMDRVKQDISCFIPHPEKPDTWPAGKVLKIFIFRTFPFVALVGVFRPGWRVVEAVL